MDKNALCRSFRSGWTGKLAAGLVLAALGAQGQAQNPPARPTDKPGGAAGAPTAQAKEGAAAPQLQPAVSKGDRQLMRDIAQANLAEIKMSALATAISQNVSVRAYAEKMLNDHYAAKDALQKIADAGQIILPHGVNEEQVPVLRKLALTAGPAFDQAYMTAAGIDGHEHSHGLFQKAATEAQDPALKAFAAEQLPLVDKHLAMAKQLTASTQSNPNPNAGAKPSAPSVPQSAQPGQPAQPGANAGR